MPVDEKHTPDFLNDNEQPKKPNWIDEVVLEFRNGNPNHLTYDQLQKQKMLALTRTAVEAAASPYISGHVENNTFVNAPEAATLEPITAEVLNYKQLSEKELSARLFEEFRPVLLGEKKLELFVPASVDLETTTRQDFDLAA
jgi:hypothetical protein